MSSSLSALSQGRVRSQGSDGLSKLCVLLLVILVVVVAAMEAVAARYEDQTIIFGHRCPEVMNHLGNEDDVRRWVPAELQKKGLISSICYLASL
eukprot:2925796-Amphidinium_carterae.1